MLAITKLNSIEILISKTSTDTSHNEIVLLNNVKRVWWDEKRSQNFKDLNSQSNILTCL